MVASTSNEKFAHTNNKAPHEYSPAINNLSNNSRQCPSCVLHNFSLLREKIAMYISPADDAKREELRPAQYTSDRYMGARKSALHIQSQY